MESGIGDTSQGQLASSTVQAPPHAARAWGWGGRGQNRSDSSNRGQPTGRNIKAKVAGLELSKKKNQTFLTPISCSKRIKVNFVQRQVASKRARPAEGLPPGLGNFPHPFSLQPFTVILMQQSPRMGVRLRLRESSAGGPRSPA